MIIPNFEFHKVPIVMYKGHVLLSYHDKLLTSYQENGKG